MHRLVSSLLFVITLFAVVAGAQYPAQPNPLEVPETPAWKKGMYFRDMRNQQAIALAELFQDFAQGQNVTVQLSKSVDGMVSVQYPEMPAVDYLNALTRDNGLVWFFDGSAIYVYGSDELESAVFQVSSMSRDELVDSLKRLGVYSEQFAVTSEPRFGMIYVSGPKRYLDIINEIVNGADLWEQKQAQINIETVVIPLQYAWADDQTFTVGEEQILVPGVASIMKAIITGDNSFSIGRRASRVPYNLPSLNGFGLIRPENIALANAREAAVNAELAAREAQVQASASATIQRDVTAAVTAQQAIQLDGEESLVRLEAERSLAAGVEPIIQADLRTNSVIIRDLRERIVEHRRILQELDQPSGLVEIKATVIDLDVSQGFQFGFPYKALWNADGVQRGIQSRIDTTNLANLDTDPGNFTFTLMDDQITQFMVNLKALEEDGNASLVSKPSVVTLNNIEAFLQETEEFYVKVSGFEQVDLFNVSVGTKLYIIPHIINEADGRRVKLNVRIEDGQRSSTETVDEIPVISRNTINTQAVLLEGQSLLIGGLVREEESSTVKGLPILSRLPKVGFLFRETVNSTQRLERMVLLTPRIIDLPNCSAPAEIQPGIPLAAPMLGGLASPNVVAPVSHSQQLNLPGPPQTTRESGMIRVSELPSVQQRSAVRTGQQPATTQSQSSLRRRVTR